jgi:hypothetical protein
MSISQTNAILSADALETYVAASNRLARTRLS